MTDQEVHFKREAFVLSHATEPIADFYQLDAKKLGEGTYGSVNKGKNKATGAVRAVKTIAKSTVKDQERFKQEISVMKELDHPNIIKLYETFIDHKNIYLVLELCNGGELFDRIIEEGFFTERGCAVLMKQIVAAILYCHKNTICHRDLKPENFLFLNKNPDSPLKIIDFGLAAHFRSDKPLTTKAGTPYYVAPQVLGGRYNEKCDVWSCGVIMYVLLCGYPPFYGDTDNEILGRVRKAQFDFPDEDWKNISKDAKELISRMLTKEESTRIDAEGALNTAWIQKLAEGSLDVPLAKNILKNFSGFRAQCKLKKVALTVIAQHLADDDIENLKKTFTVLDKNGDGTLTVKEVQEGMSKHGIPVPPDLEALMKQVDSDGSGVIDYTEFIAATMDKRLYMKEDVCWSAFRVFDEDGDGKITREELAKVLSGGHNDMMTTVFGPEAIQDMMKDVDLNNDGVIDFDEFMAMMKNCGK